MLLEIVSAFTRLLSYTNSRRLTERTHQPHKLAGSLPWPSSFQISRRSRTGSLPWPPLRRCHGLRPYRLRRRCNGSDLKYLGQWMLLTTVRPEPCCSIGVDVGLAIQIGPQHSRSPPANQGCQRHVHPMHLLRSKEPKLI